MKQHNEKTANDKELHKQLDREILLLLRAMPAEKRKESVTYIKDTYGNRKAERYAKLLYAGHCILRRRAAKTTMPHEYRAAVKRAL